MEEIIQMIENYQNGTSEQLKIITDCKILLEKTISNEPSKNLSLEIGEFFTQGIDMLPKNTLEQLIIVFFKGIEKDPLYVNEIKLYLNKNNLLLYESYGKMFSKNYGAWKVFGIGLTEDACCPVIEDMLIEIEMPKLKESKKCKKIGEKMKSLREKKKKANKESRYKRSEIRKNAKEQAIKALKKKTQNK